MDRNRKTKIKLEQIMGRIEAGGGVIRTGALLALGVDYRGLKALEAEGSLKKIRNGVYTSGDKTYSEEDLIRALFPDGVLTMESALYFYGYLKKRPDAWRIAVNKDTSKARFHEAWPRVIPYYTEGSVLKVGAITGKGPDGKPFTVYSKERLIADVLKYRDKMDPADLREAIRAYIGDEEKDLPALREMAEKRKVLSRVRSTLGIWLGKGIDEARADEGGSEGRGEKPLSTPDEEEAGRLAVRILGSGTDPSREDFLRLDQILREKTLGARQVMEVMTYYSGGRLGKEAGKDLKALSHLSDEPRKKEKWARITSFLTPLLQAAGEDRIFLDTWIPDLERYI